MLSIDVFLDLLNKGKAWHNIKEVADKASLPKPEALRIISFLARYKFILLDEPRRKAKVAEDIHRFLMEIREEEKKEGTQFMESGVSHQDDLADRYKP